MVVGKLFDQFGFRERLGEVINLLRSCQPRDCGKDDATYLVTSGDEGIPCLERDVLEQKDTEGALLLMLLT